MYRFLYHILLDLLYFNARAHKAEWKQLNSIFPNYLPKLVTFKMLFDSFLPDILSMKSVAGCESAALSTDCLSLSSVHDPATFPPTLSPNYQAVEWILGSHGRPCCWPCCKTISGHQRKREKNQSYREFSESLAKTLECFKEIKMGVEN